MKVIPYGPNSYRFEYADPQEGNDLLLPEICRVIIEGEHGWVMHHDSSPGNNNPKILKALCADGETYKYVRLSVVNSGANMLRLEVGDGAAEGSTSLQNVCALDSWNYHQQVIDTSGYGGAMFVFVHSRWLAMFSDISNDSGYQTYGNRRSTWSGCFELQTRGTSKFCWTDGHHLSGRMTGNDIDINKTQSASFPLSLSGSTNSSYRYYYVSVNDPMAQPHWYQVERITSCNWNSSRYTTRYRSFWYGGPIRFFESRNRLSRAPMVSPISLIEINNGIDLVGNVYGIKSVQSRYGVVTSIIPYKTKDDYFPSKKGEYKDHMFVGSTSDRFLIPV